MRKILWLALACLLVLAFASGCPRDEPADDDVNVVVKDRDAEGADNTIVKDGESPDTGGDTDIDINVDTKDESAADSSGDTKTDDDTTPPATDTTPPGAVKVKLVTTKGDIELTVHPEWDKVGADHFIELVNAGFYNGSPWFRLRPRCAQRDDLHQPR
jgi:hypothetical protein